ncbi:MAG TPA: hypothetical protein VFH43_14955, partial [Candidatus Kapabacteria bacterium]|nr:hypothetical protein [Candidatus Kapabacteria bacterium]
MSRLLTTFIPGLFVLAFFALLTPGGIAHAQPGKTYEQKVAEFEDSLVAVDAGLPLVDSADDRPTFSLDGQTMIFGSERFSRDPWRTPNSYRNKKWDSDLWYRKRTDTGWTPPINFGAAVNDANGAMNPTVHPRGDIVYFMKGARLWQAKWVGDRFQDAREVPGDLNKLYNSKTIAMINWQSQVRS